MIGNFIKDRKFLTVIAAIVLLVCGEYLVGFSQEVFAHTPTPTSLTATAASQTQVNLSWGGPTPAGVGANVDHHYHVERSFDGGGTFTEIGFTSTAQGTPNAFPDSGLVCGTTATYRVRIHHHPASAPFDNYSNTATTTTFGCPVQTATGTGTAIFTTNKGVFSSVPIPTDPTTLPSPPTGVTLPHGLFAFTLSLPLGVSEVTVTITFPSFPGIQYWKFQSGAYFPMPAESVVISGNQIDLTLTDGGPGDADGKANGVIVDPGGPVALGTGGSCDGRTIVTNDPSLRAQCVIVDLDAPKITKTLLTVNDFFCVEGTDDTGIARVTVNGEEVPPWQGTSGSFCAKGIVKPGQTISISATDLAGNKAGAVVLAAKEVTKASKTFASYVDNEYNPHVGIEVIVIENLNHEPLKQVRLMLSPDIDRGRFLLSDYAFKQIDKAEKVTVVMNTKYNSKDLQGYLILVASNSGILAVFPIDVEPSDFHIRSAKTHQKHPTMYLDTIDTEKLIPSRPLNSWQKAEFDRALQAIADGRSLTLTQHRVLQYATSPDHLKILHKSHQYEVWVNDGEQAITSLKGKITIKNTSDAPMNNVRIKVELASRILMFEEPVIKSIPVGDEVTVNFKSMMPENKILENEIVGKVIIAPSNHTPVQIPIVLSSISE